MLCGCLRDGMDVLLIRTNVGVPTYYQPSRIDRKKCSFLNPVIKQSGDVQWRDLGLFTVWQRFKCMDLWVVIHAVVNRVPGGHKGNISSQCDDSLRSLSWMKTRCFQRGSPMAFWNWDRCSPWQRHDQAMTDYWGSNRKRLLHDSWFPFHRVRLVKSLTSVLTIIADMLRRRGGSSHTTVSDFDHTVSRTWL